MTFQAHPRRDVERNHEAILTAAIAVLANEPAATMADIARASHTGRSTLYRHFPDRESLIEAIYERVLSEAETMCEHRLAGAGANTDPVGVLVDLATALASLGDRYRFLEHHEAEIDVQYPETRRRLQAIFHQLLAAGRQTGQIRSDLNEEWLLAMLGAVITEAASCFSTEAQRATTVRATMTSLLSPQG